MTGTSQDAYLAFFLALVPIWIGVGHGVATGRAQVPEFPAATPLDRPEPV
jgi:hypothetical protein